ncbi:MAG: hypothetical protein UMU76_05025 [Prosthecochloris sp.]|nr:hypothetical protein [Prosthecochloris sp.]
MSFSSTLATSLKKFALLGASCALLAPATAKAAEDDGFNIGGAVRYNIYSASYAKNGAGDEQFTWDTWRLNVDGTSGGIDLSFEYRFYPSFDTHFIHHGYMGYAFSDDLYGKLGVFQKPFGITTYASHSWWFQTPYYVGLEDDYDMGVGLEYTPTADLEMQLAYYRQAEPRGALDNGNAFAESDEAARYSYDIVPDDGADLKELNTANARIAYQLTDCWEIGASGQIGQIYNSALDDAETAYAVAAHLEGNMGNLNVKTEYVHYDYEARDNAGNKMDLVPMGAYGLVYDVAAEADMYVAGIAYDVPVEFGPVTSLQFYVDYTYTDKKNDAFADTQQLVPGVLVTAGPVYTYIDVAMGKNHPWLTDSFGAGLDEGDDDADWETRFNVNIGYYF